MMWYKILVAIIFFITVCTLGGVTNVVLEPLVGPVVSAISCMALGMTFGILCSHVIGGLNDD